MEETELLGTRAHDFLINLERTSMSKTYKMPVLLAFYNNGKIKMKINDDDIYTAFKEFYSHPSNAVDMKRDKGTSGYTGWGKKGYVLAWQEETQYTFFKGHPGIFSTQRVSISVLTRHWSSL